jgi:hypothetical protein
MGIWKELWIVFNLRKAIRHLFFSCLTFLIIIFLAGLLVPLPKQKLLEVFALTFTMEGMAYICYWSTDRINAAPAILVGYFLACIIAVIDVSLLGIYRGLNFFFILSGTSVIWYAYFAIKESIKAGRRSIKFLLPAGAIGLSAIFLILWVGIITPEKSIHLSPDHSDDLVLIESKWKAGAEGFHSSECNIPTPAPAAVSTLIDSV